MLKHFFILTLKSIRYRPVRSWLTILGIIIGVMLVTIILSLGNGIKQAVSNTLQMFGSDLIVVFPGKETNPLMSFIGGEKFKEKDLMALNEIEGVRFVAPEDFSSINAEFKGEKKTVMFHATYFKLSKIISEESEGIKVQKGVWPESDTTNEIMLADKTACCLFKNKIKIGDEIIVKSKRLKVAGIFAPIGDKMSDNLIFISLPMFRELTGIRGDARSANVKIEQGADSNLVARKIKYQLLKQETVRDFSVLTPEKSERLIQSVLSVVELFLVMIALISLLVGAVGIMNTMYTSVLERTKEIGIIKAVGATNDAILSLFLIESGLIGLIGGLFGIITGIVMAYIIGIAAANFGVRGLFSFGSLDFFGFLVILIITFITGVVAGALPARKASKMEPAEALRYE